MLRILLDENIPVALKRLLTGHDARTVRDMGWIGLENGDLLDAAEAAGFEVLVTADQNIRHQQNVARRKIALVVLSTSQWQTVRAGSELILQALKAVSEGSYTEVALGRPKLRRRRAVQRMGTISLDRKVAKEQTHT